MPAGSAFSAPTRATEPASSCRRWRTRRSVALRQAIPDEASLANPVDLLGSATASTYEAVLPALLADPGIDAVIALFVPPVVATAVDVADAIARVARGAEKPVLPVVMSADGARPAPSRIPNRRHARSASRPGAPPGCAVPQESFLPSIASIAPRAALIIEQALADNRRRLARAA